MLFLKQKPTIVTTIGGESRLRLDALGGGDEDDACKEGEGVIVYVDTNNKVLVFTSFL